MTHEIGYCLLTASRIAKHRITSGGIDVCHLLRYLYDICHFITLVLATFVHQLVE